MRSPFRYFNSLRPVNLTKPWLAVSMKHLLAALFVILLATPATAQDIDKGRAAYDRGDYAAALREWRPLAEQENANAQFLLGSMYDRGQGVPQDFAAAVKWYRLAAEQGIAAAQYTLGLKYNIGFGVLQDDTEAAK